MLIIDVKGEMHEHFETKMKHLATVGINLVLVGKEDLDDMAKGNFEALDGNGRSTFYKRKSS